MIDYDFLIKDKALVKDNKMLETVYEMIKELEILVNVNKEIAFARCRYIIEFLYDYYIRIYGEKSISYNKLKQDKAIKLNGYQKDYTHEETKVSTSMNVIDKETERMLDELYKLIKWIYFKISNVKIVSDCDVNEMQCNTILDYNIEFNNNSWLDELSLRRVRHKRFVYDTYNFTTHNGDIVVYDNKRRIIFETVGRTIEGDNREEVFNIISDIADNIKEENNKIIPYIEALEDSVVRIQDKNVTMVKELTSYANSFNIEEDRRRILLSALNKLKREENNILNKISDALSNINNNLEIFIDSILDVKDDHGMLTLANYLDKSSLVLGYMKILHSVLREADIEVERTWLWEKIDDIIDDANKNEFTQDNYKQLYTVNEVKCFFNIYKMQFLEVSFQYQCEKMFSDYYISNTRDIELKNKKLSEELLSEEKIKAYNNNLLVAYKKKCSILQIIVIGLVMVILFLAIINI